MPKGCTQITANVRAPTAVANSAELKDSVYGETSTKRGVSPAVNVTFPSEGQV